jgi:hypothetical protein
MGDTHLVPIRSKVPGTPSFGSPFRQYLSRRGSRARSGRGIPSSPFREARRHLARHILKRRFFRSSRLRALRSGSCGRCAGAEGAEGNGLHDYAGQGAGAGDSASAASPGVFPKLNNYAIAVPAAARRPSWRRGQPVRVPGAASRGEPGPRGAVAEAFPGARAPGERPAPSPRRPRTVPASIRRRRGAGPACPRPRHGTAARRRPGLPGTTRGGERPRGACRCRRGPRPPAAPARRVARLDRGGSSCYVLNGAQA